MTMEAKTRAVEARLMDLAGLNYVVKFEVGDDGALVIDGKAMPPCLAAESTEADCTIRLSGGDFDALLAGSLNPTLAYTLGKLKIDGSMGVALKLASMLED